MTKVRSVAALPLILSLAIIPAAQARSAQPGWRDAYGSVVTPHRSAEARLQMRGAERWFGPSPPMAPSQDRVRDPFADLHFE